MIINLCLSESCKVKTLPVMGKTNKQVELGFDEKYEGDRTEWDSGFLKIVVFYKKID